MDLTTYKITDSQVEMIALLLINLNGSTTNLDIKNQFRGSGFSVTQEDISTAMGRLTDKSADNLLFQSEILSGTNYRTFTHIKPSMSNTVSPFSTTPRKFNTTAVITDPNKVYKGCWLVTDGNEKVHMHGSITRSKARWKFAKEVGTSYSKVQCKKVK